MPQFDDQLYLGSSETLIRKISSGRGFGPLGQVYLWSFSPDHERFDNLVDFGTTTDGGTIPLIDGPGITKIPSNEFGYLYSFDVPRALSYSSFNNTRLVVYGFDAYGNKMTEQVDSPGGTTFTGSKAFKSVYKIVAFSISGPITGIIIGYSTIFGFPIRVDNGAYLISVKFDTPINQSSIIFTPADPEIATPTTGDVRGTLVINSVVFDQVKPIVVAIGLPDRMFSPQVSRSVLFGVNQA